MTLKGDRYGGNTLVKLYILSAHNDWKVPPTALELSYCRVFDTGYCSSRLLLICPSSTAVLLGNDSPDNYQLNPAAFIVG